MQTLRFWNLCNQLDRPSLIKALDGLRRALTRGVPYQRAVSADFVGSLLFLRHHAAPLFSRVLALIESVHGTNRFGNTSGPLNVCGLLDTHRFQSAGP